MLSDYHPTLCIQKVMVGQVYNQLLAVTSDISTLVNDKKKKARLALTAK